VRQLLERDHPKASFTDEGPISGDAPSDGRSIVATDEGGFERGEFFVKEGVAILILVRADASAPLGMQSDAIDVAGSVRAP
jgi:hypothetical protein